MTRHRQHQLARRVLCWMAIVVPLTVIRVDAQAQTRGGTITGVVRDSASVPIAGADIMLRPDAQRTRTDSAGRFIFTGLDPNRYTVVARKVGFLPETWDVKLTTASRTEITIVPGLPFTDRDRVDDLPRRPSAPAATILPLRKNRDPVPAPAAAALPRIRAPCRSPPVRLRSSRSHASGFATAANAVRAEAMRRDGRSRTGWVPREVRCPW